MKKKVVLIGITIIALLIILIELSEIAVQPKPIAQSEMQNLAPEQNPAQNQAPQPRIANKDNCQEVAQKFTDEHGYKNSGMIFKPIVSWNDKIGSCFLYIQMLNKWKNGVININYINDLFDLTHNSVVASFRGNAEDPNDKPNVSVCIFHGNEDHNCKSLDEYSNIVSQIIGSN